MRRPDAGPMSGSNSAGRTAPKSTLSAEPTPRRSPAASTQSPSRALPPQSAPKADLPTPSPSAGPLPAIPAKAKPTRSVKFKVCSSFGTSSSAYSHAAPGSTDIPLVRLLRAVLLTLACLGALREKEVDIDRTAYSHHGGKPPDLRSR